jgi:hypothetical protein
MLRIYLFSSHQSVQILKMIQRVFNVHPVFNEHPQNSSLDVTCLSDIATSHLNMQPWPADLPLISTVEAADGTASDELDMGVVLYSCSFVVISLMILSQVWTKQGLSTRAVLYLRWIISHSTFIKSTQSKF